MISFCKHEKYKVIDWIREPKYSTNQVLINVDRVPENIKHYLVKFTDCNSIPEWFYLSGADIRKSKIQPNGRGRVYCVDLSKRREFKPIKDCNCANLELAFDY